MIERGAVRLLRAVGMNLRMNCPLLPSLAFIPSYTAPETGSASRFRGLRLVHGKMKFRQPRKRA